MKISKIHLLCLLLALLTLLPLASCNSTPTKSTNAPSSAPVTPPPTPTPTPTPTPEPKEVKVTFGSYNIAAGREVDTNMDIIAKDIVDSGLDVVGLQEVVSKTPGLNYRDLLKELSEKTGYQYYQFYKALNMGALEGGGYGLAILSKYPIKDSEPVLLNSSTETKDYEQRVLGRATIDVESTEINFFVTHLSFEATEVRKNQFTQISELFKNYDNFVLVGDFNTQIFPEYKLIEGGVNLIKSRKYITYPSEYLSIDNIVYSEGDWSFSAPTVVETGHSDHNMIYATGTFVATQEKTNQAE